MPNSSDPRTVRNRFWPWVLLATAGWLGFVLSLQFLNPRLVPSWHGFLHTAIARQFPADGLIPENPFFAGAPLKYYWFFHWLGAGLARGLGVDALSGLRLLTLIGLVALVVAAALAGRRAYRSVGAGLVIGVFALSGVNPLGPVIAVSRHLVDGRPLLVREQSSQPLETVHVSDSLADELMSRPLLPAMYISADWRNGQNIVWFADISSRGLALAALMVLLCLIVGSRGSISSLLGTVAAGALLTALNPIVGLATCALLAGSLGLMWLVRRDPEYRARFRQTDLKQAVALGIGALAAYPTYYQLFGAGGQTGLSEPGWIALKLVVATANFLLLVPLAFMGVRAVRGAQSSGVHAVALAGALMLALVPLIHLEKGNEHNLANAACVLLAVPAVGWLVNRSDGSARDPGDARTRLLVASLLLLPMTMGSWIAFNGRPPLPFEAKGGVLKRLPDSDPVARLYSWIEHETPAEAILVVDPADPVKMSGNVSELPAFTGRPIFIDQPSYMTTPYPDAPLRGEIAARLVRGDQVTQEESRYLHQLKRPLYLVIWHADRPGEIDRFTRSYGPPLFWQGPVAVFAWKG